MNEFNYSGEGEGYHPRTYISVPSDEDEREPHIRYWRTDGCIAPADVGRVLARYYADHRLHTRLYDFNRGASHIHPDPGTLQRDVPTSSYRLEEWINDTHQMDGVTIMFHKGVWCMRTSKSKSIRAFTPIDPFANYA